MLFAWIIWGLGAVFYCYEYLLRILPSVMTDYLRNLFMINGLALGNLAALYYYAYIPMQLPAGILMDRSSPRKILASACLICALGTYGFITSNVYIAYICRFLTGLGSAFAFVGIMKLSTLWFPENYFTFITGLTTTLGMLGAMAGNMTLIHLMNWIGPKELLLAILILGIVLAILLGTFIPEHSTSNNSAPKQAQLHLSAYWSNITSLFQDSQIWLLGIIGCSLFLSLTTFAELWGIPYLMCHYNLPQEIAAQYNSLVFLGWAVGSPLMGSLASRFSNRYLPCLIAFNSVLSAVCFSLILYISYWARPYLGILLFLFGLFSSVQVLIFTIVRNLYPHSIAGASFAVTNLIVMLGGGISQPIVGYWLDKFSGSSSAANLISFSSHSFVYALSFLPASLMLVSLLSFLIKSDLENNCKQT
jgi:MFS family permease